MRKLALTSVFAVLVAGYGVAEEYPDRFVFVHRNLVKPDQMQEMSNIVQNAAACGYNGIVFWCGIHYAGNWGDVHSRERADAKWRAETSGVEDMDLWRADRRDRLMKADRLCKDLKCPLIPLVWSVGYCSMQSRDPNMTAVAPVRDVPYVRNFGKAVWEGEACEVPNGGFEASDKDAPLAGWTTDGKGKLVSRDTSVRHSGEASARFDCSVFTGKEQHMLARAYRTVKVCPHHRYRLTGWVKTKGIGERYDSKPRLMVLAGDLTLASRGLPMAHTQDWTKYSIVFNSFDASEVRVYVGAWNVSKGTVWVDDVSLEALGLRDVVRRAGTPIRVRDASTGRVYREGVDYAEIPAVTKLDFEASGEDIELSMPSESAIPPGAKLLIDCYEPIFASCVQASACLANPALKAYYAESASRIERALSPEKWFLSADEYRNGCRCELCAKAGSRAVLLAQTIRDQYEAIQAVHPGATCYAWSDMFDPNHNGHKDYYTCGDMTPHIELLPKDIVMVSWWDKKCRLSFGHFSSHGFRTLGGGFYDKRIADLLIANVSTWAEGMNETPGCRGFLYTTWAGERGNYDFLPLFANEFKRRSSPKPAR